MPAVRSTSSQYAFVSAGTANSAARMNAATTIPRMAVPRSTAIRDTRFEGAGAPLDPVSAAMGLPHDLRPAPREPEQHDDRDHERRRCSVGSDGVERRQDRLDDADDEPGGERDPERLEPADEGRRERRDHEE